MTPFTPPHIAIACGGTGGHLFPGIAVAEQLRRRGCTVVLLLSTKDVDQQAVQTVPDLPVATLPAMGLTRGRVLGFLRGLVRSYHGARKTFQQQRPQAVLAMGGFTSAAPVLAGRSLGVPAFLHESNAIPGRANRWLSWMVAQAFVGFPSAAKRLHGRPAVVTGTPTRPQFQPRDPGPARAALGLDPRRPLLAVLGGSQGASGVNEIVMQSLPLLARTAPDWQWFHVAGTRDAETVKGAYAKLNLQAVVHSFFPGMDLAMGAATAAISRAGASSLAEIAAVGLPAVLVPYPVAADNHQFHNACAFEQTGAARLLDQRSASPEKLAALLDELVRKTESRAKMQDALRQWHAPRAAEEIAKSILECVGVSRAGLAVTGAPPPERVRHGSKEGETGGTHNLCTVPGASGGRS